MRSLTALVIVIAWALPAAAIAVDTVSVGDVGNVNDSRNGSNYGSVNYAYNIGKYEVTVGQYTDFLNAVAASDTYGLYNPNMATDIYIAGIARSGASGNYSYSVIGSPNHPVTYVSWGDAARFANWLHNGQPIGAEGPGITETGAYTLNGATSPSALMAVVRNSGATWVIPTENEWYKAAYYQPAALGGDSDSYWRYAMTTNSRPYSDQPPGATPDNTRVGNFMSNDNLANGYNDGYAVTGSFLLSADNFLTDVGAYTSSPSFYGTFDQNGNVWEWTQSALENFLRVYRGGAWNRSSDSMFYRGQIEPTLEGNSLGFRVASIPEPSTLLLTTIALAALVTVRRKSVPHNRV